MAKQLGCMAIISLVPSLAFAQVGELHHREEAPPPEIRVVPSFPKPPIGDEDEPPAPYEQPYQAALRNARNQERQARREAAERERQRVENERQLREAERLQSMPFHDRVYQQITPDVLAFQRPQKIFAGDFGESNYILVATNTELNGENYFEDASPEYALRKWLRALANTNAESAGPLQSASLVATVDSLGRQYAPVFEYLIKNPSVEFELPFGAIAKVGAMSPDIGVSTGLLLGCQFGQGLSHSIPLFGPHLKIPGVASVECGLSLDAGVGASAFVGLFLGWDSTLVGKLSDNAPREIVIGYPGVQSWLPAVQK